MVSKLVHAGNYKDAALHVAELTKVPLKATAEHSKFITILQYYLHYLLENNGTEEAAHLLWPTTLFQTEPQCTKDVWQLFDEASMGLVMGAGSMSKSFGLGGRLMLEWVKDPLYTSIRAIGPTEDHLEANLFSHFVRLHQSASLPMPGEVGELFIGMSRRNQLSSIKGIVIPVGKVKKAGRLQGLKRQPRPTPHPKFGHLSPLFIFIDEITVK